MKKNLKAIFIALTGCAAMSGAAGQQADFVARNGNFWTVDEENPRAEAVAALNGRFIFVGSNADVDKHIGEDTKVIDLDGAFVTPGFYDNHVHFESTGQLLYGLNLLDVSDEASFVARIREVDSRYAAGTWITGGDWSAYEEWAAGEVAEAGREVNPNDQYGNFFLPNNGMIDSLTRDRPVLVRRFDRKVYLANSAALKLAGISKGQPDPEGIAVERGNGGEPTGALFNPVSGAVDSTVLIRDNVSALFVELIPAPSRKQRIAETKQAWQKMASVGVTSYCDITSNPIYVDIYRELRDRGEMTARVRYRPPLDRWESMADLGIKIGFGDDWIRFGGTKAWIDGIMGNSSARFYEPYTHNPSSRGIWRDIMFPFERSPDNPEEMQSRLERLALDADANGIQLTVHAIGDEANGYLMDMLERIIAKNGEKDRRFRLVHAQVMTDRDIQRAGEMNIIAEVQPFHAADDMRWMEERIGHDRSRGAYAFRRLWDSGTIVSFGSDSPGTNASRYYLNPMLGLYAAVTRKTLSGQPEGGWFPQEKLSVEEAIKAYTLNTAYAGFEEGMKGTITVGKLADFVVLSDDLLTMNSNDIKDVTVETTVVGGKVVYPAADTISGVGMKSEPRFPNESDEYRKARDELLADEKALVEKTKALAEKRRQLPLGGRLKEDYEFQWASDGKVGEPVKLSELFGDKQSLLLYNFMYGPGWDKPCLSCTSLMDGFDRTAYQVTQDAAFCGIAKAPAGKINDWANTRGWSQIELVSGYGTTYQADYLCQGENDDMQWPILHVFRKQDDGIFHFWGTELQGNHVDTAWPYWNLMDFTPEGRPDRMTPPQNFRSEFLEKHFLNK